MEFNLSFSILSIGAVMLMNISKCHNEQSKYTCVYLSVIYIFLLHFSSHRTDNHSIDTAIQNGTFNYNLTYIRSSEYNIQLDKILDVKLWIRLQSDMKMLNSFENNTQK